MDSNEEHDVIVVGDAGLAICKKISLLEPRSFRSRNNKEHLPARIAPPGLLGARDHRPPDRAHIFYTFYDPETRHAPESSTYRSLTGAPSPATAQTIAKIAEGVQWMICSMARLIGAASNGRVVLLHRRGTAPPACGSNAHGWFKVVEAAGCDDAVMSGVLPPAQNGSVVVQSSPAQSELLVAPDGLTIAKISGHGAHPRRVDLQFGKSGASSLDEALFVLKVIPIERFIRGRR